MNFVGRCDFDAKIKLFLENFSPENEYVIWGCGNAFKVLYDDVGSILKIKYFVDNDPNLQGTFLHGYKIFSPSVLFNDDRRNTKLIVTPCGYSTKSIFDSLRINGFDETTFCFAFDWLTLFKYYYRDILSVQEIAVACTTFCTLRCNGCLDYLPLHSKPKHFKFSNILIDIDKYFKVVDHVSVFTLGTGEVLLHPDIKDVLNYVNTKYGGRYGHLLIITNGTHLPNPTLMEILHKVSCHVKISNYPNLGNYSKVLELVDSFENHHINYHMENTFGTEDQEGGLWSDIGLPFGTHGMSEKEKRRIFSTCSACCRFLYDRKIFYCPPQVGAVIAGMYSPQDGDYIDIDGPVEKMDVLKYYLGVQPVLGYIPFCDRCDGLGIIANPKTITAGEQIVGPTRSACT